MRYRHYYAAGGIVILTSAHQSIVLYSQDHVLLFLSDEAVTEQLQWHQENGYHKREKSNKGARRVRLHVYDFTPSTFVPLIIDLKVSACGQSHFSALDPTQTVNIVAVV